MGIHNLHKFIKTCAPGAIHSIQLLDLSYKTLAIDTSIFIYEAKFKSNFNNETFIENFEKKLEPFILARINLIFVFDGKNPSEKKHTLEKRKRYKTKLYEKIMSIPDEKIRNERLRKQIIDVTRQDYNSAREYLTNKNIRMIDSCDEAEATCAKLVKEKKAHFVLSNDTDTLAFGASYIFKRNYSFFCISLQMVLSILNITQDQLIFICILLGCDYSKSFKTTNFKHILDIVYRYQTLDKYLDTLLMSEMDKDMYKRTNYLFHTLGNY